jgi:hypothetical protein
MRSLITAAFRLDARHITRSAGQSKAAYHDGWGDYTI